MHSRPERNGRESEAGAGTILTAHARVNIAHDTARLSAKQRGTANVSEGTLTREYGVSVADLCISEGVVAGLPQNLKRPSVKGLVSIGKFSLGFYCSEAGSF